MGVLFIEGRGFEEYVSYAFSFVKMHAEEILKDNRIISRYLSKREYKKIIYEIHTKDEIISIDDPIEVKETTLANKNFMKFVVSIEQRECLYVNVENIVYLAEKQETIDIESLFLEKLKELNKEVGEIFEKE